MRTYIYTHGAILALAALCLLSGCSIGNDGPVMAYELHGTWCTSAEPLETCLLVDQNTSPITYIWYVGDRYGNAGCTESGVLTGGLEFWPDTIGRNTSLT